MPLEFVFKKKLKRGFDIFDMITPPNKSTRNGRPPAGRHDVSIHRPEDGGRLLVVNFDFSSAS